MATEFEVRRATLKDIPHVVKLAVDLVIESRSPHRPEIDDEVIREFRQQNLEQLEMVLETPEGGIFVAEDSDGTILGHLLMLTGQTDTVTGASQAWIYDVSVRPDHQRRGVGRALMKHAEEFARRLGFHYVGLGVTEANTQALDFYRQLGYQVERVQMVKRMVD